MPFSCAGLFEFLWGYGRFSGRARDFPVTRSSGKFCLDYFLNSSSLLTPPFGLFFEGRSLREEADLLRVDLAAAGDALAAFFEATAFFMTLNFEWME